MNDVNEQRLADRVHRELRHLPDRRAPATLAPRVMAAIAARQRAPWWQQAWTDWPQGLRLAFLTFSLGLAGALIAAGWQLPQLNELTAGINHASADVFANLKPYLAMVLGLGEAVWAILKSAPPHVLWLGAAIIGLGYATCVGLGTLGYRVALNRI